MWSIPYSNEDLDCTGTLGICPTDIIDIAHNLLDTPRISRLGMVHLLNRKIISII